MSDVTSRTVAYMQDGRICYGTETSIDDVKISEIPADLKPQVIDRMPNASERMDPKFVPEGFKK